MFQVGDYIQRECPGVDGHGSIGQVVRVAQPGTINDCYYVLITEGRKGMKKLDKTAWHHSRCVSIIPRTPDWEV